MAVSEKIEPIDPALIEVTPEVTVDETGAEALFSKLVAIEQALLDQGHSLIDVITGSAKHQFGVSVKLPDPPQPEVEYVPRASNKV